MKHKDFKGEGTMQRKYLYCFVLISIIILSLAACEAQETIDHTDSTECAHIYSDWIEIVTPTCEAEGKKTRTCSNCNLTDIEYLPKLAHELTITETVDPTCTTEGYSVYLCKCGYTYKSSYTAPKGHTLKQDQIVTKTCTDTGYTHYSCENCEYEFDSDFIPPSHSFTISVTRPTATSSGFTTHTCKDCSYHYDNDFIKYTDILPTPYIDSSTPLCKGIDIANIEHNSAPNGGYAPVDWESVKAQGYDFVILKVGSDVSGKSDTFDSDYEGAKAAGLGVGAYYYAYSSTVSGTRNDAQEVLEWIKGKQFEYPIYYDIEEDYLANSLSKDSLTELITVFIEELQTNGYYAALYVNDNWLNRILDTKTILERFDIWYARYPLTEDPIWNKELYGDQLSMWQFTELGVIEGITDKIDLNYCYRDYPTLMKKWGLNGFIQEPEPPETEI